MLSAAVDRVDRGTYIGLKILSSLAAVNWRLSNARHDNSNLRLPFMHGRWGAGLPASGDMQMLFLQSAIDKMDDSFGRAAIIENSSPLFTGGTASGESQIRRWF